MPTIAELYRQGRNEELWQMSCGFTGLNLEQFMAIQKRLLLEQLELLNRCPLGEKVMRGAKPRTVEEFRQQAPITTYADYLPELMDKREDILPAKPATWGAEPGRPRPRMARGWGGMRTRVVVHWVWFQVVTWSRLSAISRWRDSKWEWLREKSTLPMPVAMAVSASANTAASPSRAVRRLLSSSLRIRAPIMPPR